MARPVIPPLYPNEPEYMALYTQWGQDNEAAYQEFSRWLDVEMPPLIPALETFRDQYAAYIRCYKDNFSAQMELKLAADRRWVEKMHEWMESIRMLLPENEKRSGLQLWDDWYDGVDKWMKAQDAWYAAVVAELETMATTCESSMNSVISGLQSWMSSMKTWRDNWPTIQ